jgi:hypothetical protein
MPPHHHRIIARYWHTIITTNKTLSALCLMRKQATARSHRNNTAETNAYSSAECGECCECCERCKRVMVRCVCGVSDARAATRDHLLNSDEKVHVFYYCLHAILLMTRAHYASGMHSTTSARKRKMTRTRRKHCGQLTNCRRLRKHPQISRSET